MKKQKQKYNKEFPRYSGLELFKENITDLKRSIRGNNLVGLVDEESGGIIAYVLRGNEERIVKALNKN